MVKVDKTEKFKIAKDIIWEVLEFENDKWTLCQIFTSKREAKEYIKERKQFDTN